MGISSKISWAQFMTISLLVFQCTPAAAQVRPIISGSLYYANMNEPAIKLESKIEPAVSLGAFVKKDRLIGSLTTNRLASFVSTKTTHTILKGISGTYFLDSNFSLSVFYVLPSQKINLEGAVGTGVNLIF